MDVPAFDEPVRRARAAYASLVGVPSDSVAMGGSVSALLGLVAAAIPDGARVATLAGEFTSTTFPFAAQAGRGVSLTELTPEALVATAGGLRRGDCEPGAVGERPGARRRRAARRVGRRRHRDGHRRDAGGGVEAAGSRLGRRHRRGGLQVAARAAGHGLDVVERQDLSLDDTARGELVCGRGAVVDDLRSAAAVGGRCPPVRHVARVVRRPRVGADAAVAGVARRRRRRVALPRAGQSSARRTRSAAE